MLVLYSTVAPYTEIMISLSPESLLKFYFLTIYQYWKGIADLKNFFRSILENFKNFLFSQIFYTDWLTPSPTY